MQKDLKIGMISGVVLVIAALIYISTRPSLSTKARMFKANKLDANEFEYAFGSDSSTETDIRSAETRQSEPTQPISQIKPKYESAQIIKTKRFHIIRKGETLSKISNRYYGSASKWSKIFRANRDVLSSPDKIKPGTKLIIPD